MKKFKFKSQLPFVLAGLLSVVIVSCERGFSDEIALATYPDIPEVFTDVPVSLTDQFFVSFDPAGGANVNGFGTDTKEAYLGTTSIRIDVPAENDPQGGYIGGIFVDRGNGRNLTNYDALTFWAKGSVTAEIGLFGFGTDFEGDAHAVGLNNVTLSTDWRKYTIPIPDASKLVQEKGVFAFSAGTGRTGGLGFTFWMDEIRFENSVIVAQPLTSIFGGENSTQTAYTDAVITTTGVTQTVTLGDGSVVTTAIAPGYLDFKTSDPFVAQVNESGEITVVGTGEATITASLNGVDAVGSLTINSLGRFDLPDAPTHAAADVISIFSDAYVNVPIDFYNGYWEPWQTTTSADFDVNGDNILSYENFNFVGHQFGSPTVDGSQMTHFHFDVFIPGTLPSGARLKVTIKDFGADGADGNGDDTTQEFTLTSADLTGDAWSSIDIPLSLSPKSKIGQLIYENDGSDDVTALYLDNVYFYKQ